MSNHFIYGSSSLLFLITTANAFIYSKLFLWKFFNLLLIFASYLCNAYGEYYPKFILFDYITISLLCLSYINQIYINCPYILITIYEYNYYNSIYNSKNLIFTSAIIKASINTYYVDTTYFYIITISSIASIIIFITRSKMNNIRNYKYIFLTYLFHITITLIVYISSFTV
jgi:hypothetical protein